jgi:glutamate decarboxylase
MNRLSEVEEQPNPYSSAGNTRSPLEEEVLQLFSPPESMSQAEQELGLRVSSLVHGFLRAPDVSSDAPLRTLAEKFRESRLPAEPSRASDYLDYLAENVVAHSTRTASPRFIGHMTSALPYFVRQLAQLMTAMNQNVVKLETAKAFSFYERQTLAMMHRLVFGLPGEFYERHVQDGESTLGAIVSGGTLANLTALWCARNAALGPREGFAGVEAEGMAAALKHYGYENAVVIGSELMHFSFDKAAGLLGFGTRQLVKVPVNRRHRVDLAALERTVAECRERNHLVLALVGVAGTTDSGAIDPLPEMADIAREAGIHFHVDAAWSGPVLFSCRHRHKLAGLERADSVTIDGHKQLYLPMGIGIVMLRDPRLAKVIEKQARYIVRPGSIDLGKRSLEGSRPGTVLFLHAALNIIGALGYEFLIEEGIRKTRHMAKLVADRPEFELLLEPEINILLYRYIPKALRAKATASRLTEDDDLAINLFNERLQKTQRQAGYSFVSRTSLDSTRDGGGIPVVALRAVIANPLTTESDIESVLQDQINIAGRLTQEK